MNETATENNSLTLGNKIRKGFQRNNEWFLVIAILLLLIYGYFFVEGYFTIYNISRLLRQLSIIGFLALGMSVVIIGGNGGIDLSVGSAFAIGIMVAITLQNSTLDSTGTLVRQGFDLPLPFIIFFVLLAGAIWGLMNGVGVAILKIPPFIMTLATMTIGRSIVMVYTQGFQFRGINDNFAFLGNGMILKNIPIPLIIFVVMAVLIYMMVHNSKFGRKIFAVGSNIRAARLSGINSKLILILTYVISGVMAFLGGMFFLGFVGTADSWAGNGRELDAISAVLVGGTPLLGGQGTIIGTILGVLFIGFLNNLMVLIGISPYVQQLIVAIMIMVVVLFQSRQS